MNDLIKQDINFLDKPIWFQNIRSDGIGFVWTDIEGYEYRSGYFPPDKVDIMILLFLLMKSQKAGYANTLSLSRYEVLKKCGMSPNNIYYKRLEDSLKRWKNVSIEFHGTFYDGKEYSTIGFGILDDYKIDKFTKLITTKFNENWLLKIKESNFFKYVNFEYYKALKRSLSRRLFEILCKTFKGRDEWSIGLVKLGIKLTLSGRTVTTKEGEKQVMYASDVLVAVKPAINEINRLSKQKDTIERMGIHPDDLFTVNHTITGKGQERVIHFKKIPVGVSVPANAKKASNRRQPVPSAEQAVLDKIPPSARESAKMALKKRGIEETQEIVGYVDAQIQKGNVKDVAAYLATCFSKGYGAKTTAERTAEQEREARITELRREADQLEKGAEAETQQLKDTVARQNVLLAALTPEQDAELSRLAEQNIEAAGDYEKKRYRLQKKAGETTMLDRYKRGLVEEFAATA
ncbi:MAG: replication initiator protein A [Desulfamplus sp.]|nr:replication initiator protein A [Desulfamplus sp.]